MTWGEIQVITLQKMFSIDGDEILHNALTKPYLKGMPAAANEGLQLLATAGRFIKKELKIAQLQYSTLPPDDADICNICGNGAKRYDFAELAPDFYSFNECEVYIGIGDEYSPTESYDIEGDSVILLPGKVFGLWRVYYNAYPRRITADTPREQPLAIHPEAAVLLPLYMASQLFKEDDIGLATQYRNEFEVGREILLANAKGRRFGKGEFLSTTRWW